MCWCDDLIEYICSDCETKAIWNSLPIKKRTKLRLYKAYLEEHKLNKDEEIDMFNILEALISDNLCVTMIPKGV